MASARGDGYSSSLIRLETGSGVDQLKPSFPKGHKLAEQAHCHNV